MNRKSADDKVGVASGLKMNWSWPSRTGTVLTDNATSADNRLKAIKRAAKTLKKSVEDSLRTSTRNKNDDLEVRKKRSNEFVLGDNIATAVHGLCENKTVYNEHCSPLNTVLERYANFEKTIGHMLAANEVEIATFLGSDTPLSKLLNEDIPAVTAAKKELDHLTRRQVNAQGAYDKETKKLEKMASEDDVDPEMVKQQDEKTRRLLHEVECISKELSLESDKLTSNLLTLVSRENRYATSILELMRIKKQFYANAFNTISAELPYIERILQETQVRPVFGEPLEDHLSATGRSIAFPIALSVFFLRDSGLNDEGLFRISTKQIKLDKVKSFIDANLPLTELLQDCDCHFYAAMLKSYLRELPLPLLSRKEHVHDRWIAVTNLTTDAEKIREIRYILKEELVPPVVVNIQYLVKFLAELTRKSKTNKMTPNNLGIVLGPTLLWRSSGGAADEHSNIDRVIKVVSMLVEKYDDIFPVDISWAQYDEGIAEIMKSVNEIDQIQEVSTERQQRRSLSPHLNSQPVPEPMPSPSRLKRPTLRTKFLSKINNNDSMSTSKESSPQ